MPERWTNAVFRIVVPLDCEWDTPRATKQHEVGVLFDELAEALPPRFANEAASATWEDVEDGEPVADLSEVVVSRTDLEAVLEMRTMLSRSEEMPAAAARLRAAVLNTENQT